MPGAGGLAGAGRLVDPAFRGGLCEQCRRLRRRACDLELAQFDLTYSELTKPAAFRAALAFRLYRGAGGVRTNMLADFLIETEPFAEEYELLPGSNNVARQRLKERYGQRLEIMYAEIA